MGPSNNKRKRPKTSTEASVKSKKLTHRHTASEGEIIEESLGKSSNVSPATIHVHVDTQEEDEVHVDTQEEDEVDSSQRTDSQYQVPYYLESFVIMLDTVLGNEHDKSLFDDDDLHIIETFMASSDEAKKLYVRLIQRKHRWLPTTKIKYPGICDDPETHLDQLVRRGFLESEQSLENVSVVLPLLQLQELKTLAKSMKIAVIGKNKTDLVHLLHKQTQQKTVASMFFNKPTGSGNMILRRAKELIGCCYRITDRPKDVFMRIMVLFCITTATIDDEQSPWQQQIFNMLMTKIGQVKYASYEVRRKNQIFQSKLDVQRFVEAMQFEQEILSALERNANIPGAYDVYLKAKSRYGELCRLAQFHSRAQSLPTFLRRFTVGAVYTRVFTQGVDAMEKSRNYADAVSALCELIGQDIYHVDYRGRWYERLALNLETHMKEPEKALEAIGGALSDPTVRGGHRYGLYQRAVRICRSPSNKRLKSLIKEMQHDDVREPVKVTMEGRLFPRSIPGRQTVFITQGSYTKDSEDIVLCGVEELALSLYKEKGFNEGIHGEGGTFTTLFGLLFWDDIYKSGVPDVFHNPCQTEPLDLRSDMFYENRHKSLEHRLREIRASSTQALNAMLSETWDSHVGELCSVVSWQTFKGLDHVKSLVQCIGSSVLGGICEKYVHELRHWRGGMPDLVVWNTETNAYKVVEVKGPGDRLSNKQILWLDYLMSLGVDAEVCHISGIGSKKLTR